MPQQVADKILAVVNERIITLTDVQVYENFLFSPEEVPVSTQKNILDRFIDQMLVIQMTQLEISIDDTEIEERLNQIKDVLGQEELQNRLNKLGMDQKDLMGYISDALLFDKIISQMFEKDVFVSLAEIETYYEKTFLPENEALAGEIPPILDVAGEVENIVKKKKIEKKAADWIESLRKNADIKIFEERRKDNS